MEMLQKYRLLEKLGDGAQGTVYRAQDQASLQPAAIRTLGPGIHTDPSTRQRFEDECRTIAGLKHPNIACIRDYGDDGEIPFLVTEWLTGRDLRAVIADKTPFLVEQKLSILMQVGEALEHAVNSGVVHRNLRPSKIHLTPDGKVKIRDFGGAAMQAMEIPPDILREWQRYMAPEQIRGGSPTAESNIFSLGLIAYEFCTGAHPFAAEADGGGADPLASPSSFPTVEQFPELPLGLWPIVEKCLASDPAERFPAVPDFRLACLGLISELAEDSQLLLMELQTALPRLRTAAGVEGAPPEISRLTAEVEMALHTGVKSGYQLLNRLAADLAEHHSRLLPAAATPSPFLFEPDASRPAEGTPTASESMEALPQAPVSLQATEPALLDPLAAGLEPPETTPVTPGAAGVVSGPHANADADTGSEDRLFTALQTGAGGDPLWPLLHGSPDSTAAAQAESSAALYGLSMPADAAGNERAILLLKEIDQARETFRKAVERFQIEQSGPQAAPAPDQSSAQVVEPKPDDQEAVPAPVSQEVAVPAAEAEGANDPYYRSIRNIEVAENHPEDSALPLEETESASAASHRQSKSQVLWVVAPALLLGVALGTTVWLRTQPYQGSTPASSTSGAGGPLTSSQASSQDPLSAAKNAGSAAAGPEVRRNILLEEARNLGSAGLRDESRVFLNRLLELYPGYRPALDELNQIEAESKTATTREDPAPAVRNLLASALSAIKGGNLPKAKADLDRADKLQPGLPDVAALRRRWQTKKAEITAADAREQEKQKELARRQKIDTLTQQADDFYRLAKYPEALALAEEQLSLDPQFTQALELRIRTIEAQRNLKSYEASLVARQYPDALAALDKLERINPADPNLTAYRKRIETESGGGRAVLSVHALGEAAELMLDDRPAGAKGELVNKTIPTGRHRITLRNNAGPQIEQAVDLTDGQKVYLVYDLTAKLMRPMTEADRETLSRRQARQEVHRFAVEHVHGIFRGSCKGTLAVNYFDVEFTPETGNHAFSRPFRNLKLRIEDRNAVLLSVVDNKEFSSFKFPDAQSAEALKKLWGSLLGLDR